MGTYEHGPTVMPVIVNIHPSNPGRVYIQISYLTMATEKIAEQIENHISQFPTSKVVNTDRGLHWEIDEEHFTFLALTFADKNVIFRRHAESQE
jgi:hypothetical protein